MKEYKNRQIQKFVKDNDSYCVSMNSPLPPFAGKTENVIIIISWSPSSLIIIIDHHHLDHHLDHHHHNQ